MGKPVVFRHVEMGCCCCFCLFKNKKKSFFLYLKATRNTGMKYCEDDVQETGQVWKTDQVINLRIDS